MKVLTVIMTLGLLVFLAHEAVTLQKLTVCRQEAWRSSVRLHTRALLTRPAQTETDPIRSCRILVTRNHRRVVWKRFPLANPHSVSLSLEGHL